MRSALCAAAPVAVAATAATVLLRCPPEQSSFYPRCPVYALFHFKCPGCGATRALAALLRGQLAEAWHWNALFTVAAPFCLVYGVAWYGRWLQGEKLRRVQTSPAAVCGMLGAAAVFMVLRNVLQGRF